MSETDLQLLTRYANQRAEDAFAEIVRRYVDLVHSAALRQVRSPELAEEVAQAVFIELARQARLLPPRTVLAAWLYHVTRRRAIDVVRREAGRRLREQTAQELQTMNATAEDWTHIEPLLDDAMDALEETDRLAVLLRYFQNKPLHEVGQAIGVTDDAAQKRVSRAVERLREFFTKRGVTVGASGLVVVISANAVQAAPVGLAFAISTAASAIVGATSTVTATVTKAIAMTTMQKTLLTTALVVAISTAVYEAKQAANARTEAEGLRQRLPGVEQANQIQAEGENFAQELATLRAERDSWNQNAAELARLRRDATALQQRVTELSNQVATASNQYGLPPGQMPPVRSSSVTENAQAYAGLVRKLAAGQISLAEEFNLAKAWPYLERRFWQPEDFANFQSSYLTAYLGVNDEAIKWEMRRILETARQKEDGQGLRWARMTDEEIQRIDPGVDLDKIRRQWNQLSEQNMADVGALLSDSQRESVLSTFNTLLDFDPRLKSSYPNNADDPKYQGVSSQEAMAAFFPPRPGRQFVPAKTVNAKP